MGARSSIVTMLISAVIMAVILEIPLASNASFPMKIVSCFICLVIATVLGKILSK